MADGDVKSIGGRKNFPVDRQTELTPLFRSYINSGSVRFVKADEPVVVEGEAVATPSAPVAVPEVPETTSDEASSSDSPGRTLESDADASAEVVDPADTQTPEGEPDSPESGASESQSRKGSTDDGSSGKKGRKKRRGRR
jgi:hypothetical protein